MPRFLLCLLFAFSFSSCAYIEPLVQDFNIVSIPQEVEISNQMATQISGEMNLISGTSTNREVNRIGNRLLQGLPNKQFDYQFFVVEDKTPNAFAIPGGKIYVHTGLLDFTQSEDELAGVIGHEIGHAYERHPVKSLSRAHGMETLTQKIFKNSDSHNALQKITLGLAKTGILTRYGRGDEHEADDIGYELIKRAGYSTDGLLKFLQRLQSLEKPGAAPPTFLSTHPPTPDRIARLKQLDQTGSIVSGTSYQG